METVILLLTPLVGGYLLDLVFGDPKHWPHPIVGFGRLIAWGERSWNRGPDRVRCWRGALLVVLLVAGAWAATAAVLAGAAQLHVWVSALFGAVVVFFGLAHCTLIREGRGVFAALERSLPEGRQQVARIVGRDTAELDEQQVRTAVFETMAENLSDGVVAPLFYLACGGPPAMMAYKMVNTLDSMIAHRDERYEWFGKVAARLDDAANYVPARLTAGLMVLLAGSARAARFCHRYGRAHASPNSGFPEAALAGVLDLRFGGPLRYGGDWVVKPWIGENPRRIEPHEIRRVVRLHHGVAFAAVTLAALLHLWLYA